jgi:hypothetical protein
MISKLRAAWPGLPPGLGEVCRDVWQRVAATPVSEGQASPINDFTIPLATMARQAGFEHDLQGKEFIRAAMEAAEVPVADREIVQTAFLVQLHAGG